MEEERKDWVKMTCEKQGNVMTMVLLTRKVCQLWMCAHMHIIELPNRKQVITEMKEIPKQ